MCAERCQSEKELTVEHGYSAVDIKVSCLEIKRCLVISAVGQGDELGHDLTAIHGDVHCSSSVRCV